MNELEKIKTIDIHPFDTAQKGSTKGLVQYNGVFFEVSPLIVELLLILQKASSVEEGIEQFVASKNHQYTTESIKTVVEKNIYPMFEAKNKNSFLIKKEFLKGEHFSSLSNYLKVLFKKPLFIALFSSSILLNVMFYYGFFSKVSIGHFDIYTLLLLLTFFLFSSFFHELGHASATQYYKVGHGGVGVALYWNFPVFYTDISKIWKLPIKERCVVNLGGVYFQSILLIPILVLFFTTHNELLKYIILLTNINTLITLNPFFKFDGYWLITDICGVPNLRKRLNEFLRYLIAKIRKKEVPTPYLLQLKNPQRTFLLIYFILSNAFMCFYFLYLLPRLLYHFVQEYPQRLEMVFMELSSGILPDFRDVQYLFTQTMFIAFVGYMCYLLCSKLIRIKI
ncbi:hypothetical protein [Capnocytophaga sp.]